MGLDPELVLEIIRRESQFDPSVCNREYGCKAGQGLFQVIPSTEKHCEEKLGRELDMFDIDDNLDCGLYLLKTDGISHWEGDGTWGSGPYNL